MLIPDLFSLQKNIDYPPHLELVGSWLQGEEFIVLEPTTLQRHSITTSLPEEPTLAMFAIEFSYTEESSEMEVKIVAVPKFVASSHTRAQDLSSGSDFLTVPAETPGQPESVPRSAVDGQQTNR
jgi:hypothetical protein